MKSPMTPRGYDTLRKELQKLKSSRPELANAIEVARAHGDLSENADYDAAKEKSGMVEAKIRDIEARLSNADVIDPRNLKSFDRVVFGTCVKVEDCDSGDQRCLCIVGSEESNIDRGWISFESPLARALIGKEVGEVVKAVLPAGAREYEILEVYVDYQESVD